MNYEDFRTELLALVNDGIADDKLEGVTARLDSVMSTEGPTDRLIVSVEGSNMSMAFRVRDFYERNQASGKEVSEEISRIMGSIKENLEVIKTKEDYTKSFLTDYDKAKDHLMLRLIPGDSPILEETPHRMYEDMAMVVNINLDSLSGDDGRAVAVVNDGLLGMYGIDEKELFEKALSNSMEKEPYSFQPLDQVVANMMADNDFRVPEDSPIAVVATNASGFHGASILGYPDFLEKAAEYIGGSFYMIPSSVHEFILIKEDGRCDPRDLNSMIKETNATVVSSKDRLGDQCYHYDAEAKVLQTGLDYSENRTRGENKIEGPAKADKPKTKKAGAR